MSMQNVIKHFSQSISDLIWVIFFCASSLSYTVLSTQSHWISSVRTTWINWDHLITASTMSIINSGLWMTGIWLILPCSESVLAQSSWHRSCSRSVALNQEFSVALSRDADLLIQTQIGDTSNCCCLSTQESIQLRQEYYQALRE